MPAADSIVGREMTQRRQQTGHRNDLSFLAFLLDDAGTPRGANTTPSNLITSAQDVEGSSRVAHPAPHPPPAAEPRRGPERYPEQRTSQSLPVVPRQSGLVASDPYNHMTIYQPDRHGGPGKPWSDRREQSLPSRRPAETEKSRQALSAPSRKNRSNSQPRHAPLPKVNTLMAKAGDQGGTATPAKHVVTTSFAGISTRENEATHQKSNKFASNWAEVRLQNHIQLNTSSKVLENTTVVKQQATRGPTTQAKICGPGPTPRRDVSEDDKTREDKHNDRRQGPSPDRYRAKGDHSPRKPTDAWSPGKENAQSDSPPPQKKEPQPSPFLRTQQLEKKKAKEEKPTIRFAAMPEEERPAHSRAETQGTHSTATPTNTASDPSSGHSPAPKKRRPQWNSRLNTSSPPLHRQRQQKEQQQQRKSWRRYEAELTHAPDVTTNQQVYQAYTGHTKRQLQHAHEDDSRPSTTGSAGRSSLEEAENREHQEKPVAKEYILTRNEAKMYIHIQNVYGSDAYRQKRKELFMKKLTEVQMKDLKEQMEEKRRRQQRKEESRKRQHAQLSYVRRKFRRGQVHRFRTQYVTSRVLEYERDDRDLFGLPDEEEEGSGEGGGGSGQKDRAKKGSSAASPSNRRSPERNDKHETDKGAANAKDGNSSSSSSRPAQSKPTAGGAASNASSRNKEGPAAGSGETKTKDNAAAAAAVPKKNTSPNAGRDPGQRTAGRGGGGEDSSRRQPDGKSSGEGTPAPAAKNTDSKGGAGQSGTGHSTTLPHAVGSDSEHSQAQQQRRPGEAKAADPQPKSGVSEKPPAKSGNANVVNGAKRQDDSKDKTQAQPKAVTFRQDVSDQSTAKEPGEAANTSSKDRSETETQNTRQKPVSQEQQQQAARTDKSTDKPAASVAPKTSTAGAAVKTTNGKADAENGAKPGATEKSGIPAGKSGVPAAEEESQKSEATPNGVLQNGVLANGADDHSPRRDYPRKKTTITKDSKGRYITTTKDFRVPDHSKPEASKSAAAHGDRNEPGPKPDDNADNKKAASSTQPAPQGGKSNPAAGHGRQSDAHAGRRKSTHAHPPKTEEETKKQIEKKYGKMFDMNIGRSRKTSASTRHPKMEGIDTVVVKVTDEKGRKRMQKRQVKDVVKDAKATLAVPDPDAPRRGDKGGKQAQTTGMVRTASVDTLDFDDDDDDDDDDDEDVFERVRRKYNLQIDSDDEDGVGK